MDMTDDLAQMKENPIVLKYVRLLRIILWTVGAWPGEILGEKIALFIRCHRVLVPFQAFVATFAQIYYVYEYFATISFYTKGLCFIVILLSVGTFVRGYLPNLKQYGVLVKYFFVKFHLIQYKHLGEHYQKTFAFMEKLSSFFTWILMGMMVFGCLLFNISPLYLNYINGAFTSERKPNTSLEFSVHIAFPGFNPNDHFLLFTYYNFYASYNCATTTCAIDLLLYLMVFQIIGHLQILRQNLKNFPMPKKKTLVKFIMGNKECEAVAEMYDEEENGIIFKKLVDCMDYHKLIVSFTNDLSHFFGPMLALTYMLHLICCCLLLLECSQGDPSALIRFGPLTIIIFGQLVQMSITFEIVNTMSEKLTDSVYMVPWECMDTRNRRVVRLMLHRMQTPIQVRALGLTTVGVNTMVKILKTTFTYFTFLRSMNI